MFARVLVIVLSLTATGVALLALRQAEHRAGHELARARLDIMELEGLRRRLRAEIARETSPERVRLLADVLGDLAPASPNVRSPEGNAPGAPSRGGGPASDADGRSSHPDTT